MWTILKTKVQYKLDEFGERYVRDNMPIPSQASNHFEEGVETTGGKMGSLNNQQERPTQRCDEIVRPLWKHKVNKVRVVSLY